MDLENICLEKQVNLILLSKVIKNNLALKKKTGLSLFEIHRILQNQEAILELWKEKVQKLKNLTKDKNALEALLLEWIRQCKLKKCKLSGLLIHEQVKYLMELFRISYKINLKTWTEIKIILGEDFYSTNSLAEEPLTFNIYDIFVKDGKRLLEPEIYERFLELLDVKAIKKSSRKVEGKNPKKKSTAAKERKVNKPKINHNGDDDDVIAIENPITIVDLSNDDTEMFKSITKDVSLTPPLSDHSETMKTATFSFKDFEPPDNRKRKDLYIKQEPRDYIETEAENVHNHLDDEQVNEFEDFLYISDSPTTNTFRLEEPDEDITTNLNNKHEITETDNDYLNPERRILIPKVEDNSKEIKSELDLFFLDGDDDNDSECIEIYQIVESDNEDDDSLEQENSTDIENSNKNEFIKNDIKKPIEIEFSDFDCLQIKLKKNCDKTLEQMLKEDNNKINKTPEEDIEEAEEEEESEETQIELEIADTDEDEQNELREIINKYNKEITEKCKPENLLRTSKLEERSSTEEQEEEEAEECEIVLEIVSDEEDDDVNNEIISDLLKSKEFKEIGKRSRSQTADDNIPSLTSLSYTPCRKVPRLNSTESVSLKDNDDFKYLNHVRDFFRLSNDKKSNRIVATKQRTF